MNWIGLTKTLAGANAHKTPSREARDDSAVDGQTRARLEFSGLYALRRFASEMLHGSPCNPTLIIKPPPEMKVKQRRF
jgi:hypothetical protein